MDRTAAMFVRWNSFFLSYAYIRYIRYNTCPARHIFTIIPEELVLLRVPPPLFRGLKMKFDRNFIADGRISEENDTHCYCYDSTWCGRRCYSSTSQR